MKVSAGLMATSAVGLAFVGIDWMTAVRGQVAPGEVPPPVAVPAPPNVAPSATFRRFDKGDPSDRVSSGLRAQDYELGRQAESLASQYGAAKDDGAKEKLRGQLRDVLDKQFTVHHKRREQELAKLEERVRSLRDLLNKRSEQRQTIVDRRLEQLVRDAEGLGWSAPSSGSTPSAGAYPNRNVFSRSYDDLGLPTTTPAPYGAGGKQPPARR